MPNTYSKNMFYTDIQPLKMGFLWKGKKNILLELKVERNWKEALTKTAVYIASIYRGMLCEMQGFKTRLDQKFRASDGWTKWEKRLKILTFISVYMEYVPTRCELFSLILLQQKILQCCLQVNHLRVIAVLQFITHWPLCVPLQLTFVKGQCFAAKCHHWIFSLVSSLLSMSSPSIW